MEVGNLDGWKLEVGSMNQISPQFLVSLHLGSCLLLLASCFTALASLYIVLRT